MENRNNAVLFLGCIPVEIIAISGYKVKCVYFFNKENILHKQSFVTEIGNLMLQPCI